MAILAITNAESSEKLSPNARLLMKHKRELAIGKVRCVVPVDGRIYGCLVKVRDGFTEDGIEKAGGTIGTKAGNILTVRGSLDAIEKIAALEGVIYVQVDEPIEKKLDKARIYSFVDSVQAGVMLEHGSCLGDGVVTGIIDCGFDYTNPSFYDENGQISRIKAVWEQKRKTGVPPQGYSYGRELTGTEMIYNAGTDTSKQSHGSHVAGIVCGSGYGTSGLYRGVAPNSDIVFVGIHPELEEWTSTSVSSIVDGMAYILKYADSVGKPAICNLSWGLTLGPHDGTSLFCQAVNNLSGPGKILVVAAGNEGDENIHFNHSFTPTDTIFRTFFNFSKYYGLKRTCIDFWGDSLCDYRIRLSLYDTINKKDGNSLSFNVRSSVVADTFMIGSDNDTCFVSVAASASDFNGKPRMLVYIDDYSMDKVMITGTGTSGNLNFWNSYVDNFAGIYGTFSDDSLDWAKSGNTDITIGDFACGDSAISVAAYITKNKWVSINNYQYSYKTKLGSLASFSSHGPRVGGLSKPDIAAPGFGVVSCVNSFDSSFLKGHNMATYTVKNYLYNSKYYSYSMLAGTSMATPMVSGVIALMLEKNPTLGPSEIRKILQETATVDSFVTDPDLWGAGKLNAWAAMRVLDGTNDVEEPMRITDNEEYIYPNPTTGAFSVNTGGTDGSIELLLYDIFGNCLCKKTIAPGEQSVGIDAGFLPSGQYFVQLKGCTSTKVLNLKIVK